MAIIHFINYKSQSLPQMKYVLKYAMRDSKTVENGVKYVTGINCTPASAYTEFCNTKNLFNKNKGRLFYHMVQSFDVKEKITPETAHKIALELAEKSPKLKEHEITVSTHCDRNHIHSHFVINSVNASTGKKFHISENEINDLMNLSDEICLKYGFSVIEQKNSQNIQNSIGNGEKYSLQNNECWKLQMALTVDECMSKAKSKKHFIFLMSEEGYKVSWSDKRKHITFTDESGNKCRGYRLHDSKYLKENMENEFRIRSEIFCGLQRRSKENEPQSIDDRINSYVDGKQLESDNCTEQFADRMDIQFNSGSKRSTELERSSGTDEQSDGGKFKQNEEVFQYCFTDENGHRKFISTGWEAERNSLIESYTIERTGKQIYEKALSDYNRGDLDTVISNALDVLDIFESLSYAGRNDKHKNGEDYYSVKHFYDLTDR